MLKKMKKRYLSSYLLVFFLILGIAANSYGQKVKSSKAKRIGVQLLSKLYEKEVKVGEDIIIKLKLTNNGLRDISTLEPFAWCAGNRVEIRNSKGNKMPLSEETQKRRKHPPINCGRRSQKILRGKEFKYEVNISEIYDLPVGKYKITIWRYVFVNLYGKLTSVEIESNPVEVLVIQEDRKLNLSKKVKKREN